MNKRKIQSLYHYGNIFNFLKYFLKIKSTLYKIYIIYNILFFRNTISVTKNILSYPTRIGDCKEEHFSTPRCAKHCFDLVVKKISEHKKRLDASRKQITRLKSKIQTLEDVVHKLQDKQLISENAAQILLIYISRIFKI